MKVEWRNNSLFAGNKILTEIEDLGDCFLCRRAGISKSIDKAKEMVEAYFEIENGELDVEWHNKKFTYDKIT